MADRDLNVNINAKVNDQGLDEFVDQVEKLENEKVTVDFDLRGLQDFSQLSQRMRGLADDLEEAKRRAQSLGQTDVRIRVQADNIDQVESQLVALGQDITRIDDQTIDIRVQTQNIDAAVQGIRTAGDEALNLGTKANQAVGGLQNLSQVFGGVGQESFGAAQGVLGLSDAVGDLAASSGALAGIASSLPLIGTAVAGAVIGLTLLHAGVLAIGDAMVDTEGDIQDFTSSLLSLNSNLALTKEALDKIVQDKGTESFFSGLAKGLVSAVVALSSLPVGAALFVLSGGIGDIERAFDNSEKRAKAFNDQLKNSPELAAAFLDVWKKSGSVPAEELAKYEKQLSKTIIAQVAGNVAAQKYGDTVDTITKAVEAGMEVTTDNVDLLYQQATAYLANKKASEDAAKQAEKDAADQARAQQKLAEDYAEASRSIQESLGAVAAETVSLAAETKTLNDVIKENQETAFAVHEAYAKDEDALADFGDKVKELIPDLKKQNKELGIAPTHLTTFSAAGRKALEATDKLAGFVKDDLSQAFRNSNGSLLAVQERAQQIRDELTQKLKVAGVDPSEIENYFEFLRLNPPQIEADVKLAQLESVQAFVNKLLPSVQTVINDNPPLQVAWVLATAQNDPVAQLAVIAAAVLTASKNNPVAVATVAQLEGTLTPEQRVEFERKLAALGFTVSVTPTLGQLPDGTVVETAPGLDLTVGVNAVPKPVKVPPGSDLATASAYGLADGFDVNATPVAVPLPAGQTDAATAAMFGLPAFVTVPVKAEFEGITADMDPATASALGIDITSQLRNAILRGQSDIPIPVVPMIDTAAQFRAKEEADKVTKTDDGKDRVANIDVKVTGDAEAKKKIDNVATNDGHGYKAEVKVTADTSGFKLPPAASSGGGGGTGGGTRTVVVNQTINAGFGTDRFALERAVRKANHRLNRLAGIRA